MSATPILLLGAGRMGGALIGGWLRAGAFAPGELMIRDPDPGPEALGSGALIDPSAGEMVRARTVVLAVKPQVWRAAAAETVALIAPDAVIVSICAGVSAAALAQAFAGRKISRVMPTIAAAIGRATASVFAADSEARARAHALMGPLGAVVDIEDEDQMHAATAISGSGPAYLYAFVEALEAAGAALGLSEAQSSALARATVAGAAALMGTRAADPALLRRQVTSPGGTTEAALEVLMGEGGLGDLMIAATAAAERRSRELGARAEATAGPHRLR